jgi:putative transposase
LITSEAEAVSIPQFARKAERRKKQLNKVISRRKKGSNCRRKAVERLAKHHQKTARQRKDFHFKTVRQLVEMYDVIAYEGETQNSDKIVR